MEKSEEQAEIKTGKIESASPEAVESACPSCACVNEASAVFCEECGATLKQPVKCPKCGAAARPRADICEVCGTWLLEGQCVFCYDHVDEGQSFCGECGNPPEGIVCPECGKSSNFDFCKSCNIPLSIQAREMAEEAARDPGLKEISSLFEQLTSVEISQPSADEKAGFSEGNPAPAEKTQDDDALKLKAYRESLPGPSAHRKPKSAPKSLFSGNQKESINQLANEVAREEERKRLEEEKRRKEEERKRKAEEERRRQEEEKRRQEEERQRRLREQLNDALRKLSGKTFSSQQEARRFFMNMIAGLPEEVARKITNRGLGWLCNAYDCLHDSPAGCGKPDAGGVWLIR